MNLIEIKSIDKSKAQLLELSQKGIELQNEGYKYWQKAQEYIEQTINHAELEIFYTIVKKMESLEIPKTIKTKIKISYFITLSKIVFISTI